jgi:hypothetical protein
MGRFRRKIARVDRIIMSEGRSNAAKTELVGGGPAFLGGK